MTRRKNDDRVVTFHDSCNVARGSRLGDTPGGQFTIPRDIIRAVANRFVDMAPGTTHEATSSYLQGHLVLFLYLQE